MEIFHIIKVDGNELYISSYFSFSRLKRENHELGPIDKKSLPVKIGTGDRYILICKGDLDERI